MKGFNEGNESARPRHWTKPKLTGKQREEICRRYADGETAVSLAAEFKVSAALIKTFVPPRTKAKPPKLTPAQRVEITRRYRAGELSRDLAAEFGVSRDWVKQFAGPREGEQ